MRSRLAHFLREAIEDRRGGVAVMFAFALLPLLGFAGLAVDYATLTRQRSAIQSAADTGALAAARELHLAQIGSSGAVTNIATTYANTALGPIGAQLSNVLVSVNLINSNTSIQVSIKATYRAKLFKMPVNLTASATASAAGIPICGLTLDPSVEQEIYLRTQAQLTAQSCAIQANSNDSNAIYTQGSSHMTAGTICSVGGAKGKFAPTPLTDCPAVPDPLASRPAPPISATCLYSNEVINGGTVSLLPGKYCGGLYVTGGAIVTFTAGEYIMSGGPLKVDSGSSLITSGAGIYLTGAGATLWFGADTTINMTAPTGGPLAGLLVYEDHAAPSGQVHYIYSDNAPVLHGTIYLPVNQLWVETSSDVSKASAFTIIVAQSLHVDKAANLWLNSNYNLSNVPVPGGLGPGYPYLSQ